ncbi:hypothetical protein B7Y94_01280 [Candidatus Saccharibacteria bacterium 32-49-12]|nr:MAG: hypothetical protein B7Y94_01280 [Candidatus Saccharibacteria bacterium 32-49-12]
MNRINVNETVAITELGFNKKLVAYPRRMEFRGRVYEFVDAGLRCLVQSGGRMAQILTLSDGHSLYRLKSDASGGIWTLVSITND